MLCTLIFLLHSHYYIYPSLTHSPTKRHPYIHITHLRPYRFALERSSGIEASELSDAQSRAKAQLRGLWAFFKEEPVSAEGEGEGEGEGSKKGSGSGAGDGLRAVKVSEVLDGSCFYIQYTDSALTDVEAFMSHFSVVSEH